MFWRCVRMVGVILFAFASLLAAETSSGQREVASELLHVLGVERAMMAGMTTMLDVQIQQNPTLGPFRETMLKWAEKYMTWEEVSPQFIDLYASTFTEAELNDLLGFYKTPTGQKALAEMPGLMQKGAAMGVANFKKYAPQLEQMIRERAQELEKATEKSDPDGA